MLLLTIDRKSPSPIYRQIIDTIVKLVDGGTLASGDRLPPSRTLAESAGIHRSSVRTDPQLLTISRDWL
jgi:DNA-binding transcriptional regulator YhcF (GntR family)